MNALARVIGKHSDIALVLLVLGVLVVLFAPIPSGLLDFLILANFSFAFLVLLLTFYMARPVEFSTFPSLLLIATLFRLSLNVAATRLILSDGDAGRVIGSIGAFVVGGNYVIGLIVFLILIVVQYVVVTSGAQRVSEVAARFTLDSMPGQQMSIDADLNMGFIDQAEAQRRRKNLEKEAGFYGAMDGASKFVKGDAIAGIIILLINIVGGLIIGVMQHGLPWSEALKTYTLLTIGDGIVTQVPALVIAVGTGIIVTRSASDSNLSREALRQIGSFPKTLLLVAMALGGLLALPGIPALPTLALAACFLTAAMLLHRAAKAGEKASEDGAMGAQAADGAAAGPEEKTAGEDPYALLKVEPVEVHLGRHWVELVNQPGSVLMERIATFRKQHAQEFGLVLPRVRFKDAPRLSADRYEIHLDGVLAGKGEARADKLLAIHPAGDVTTIAGEATKDPTYGLPALWIDESQRSAASQANFTLVDAPTVFMTHLTEMLRRESASLLTRAEVERLLARVRQEQPGLVEELIPTVLSSSDVQKVLQNLLREKVSIRNVEAILETLADAGRSTRDPSLLTEMVRQRLGHAICHGLLGEATSLQVLTLDPAIESQFLQSLQAAAGASSAQSFVLEPRMTEQLMKRMVQQAERMMKSNLLPVLLCAPELRRHLRTLAERVMPHLRVLAMTEVPHTVELKSFAVIQL
ncbi:flagellar biosynthesis protein FlhA [Variovorax arabinosiphilus]|uniref:flagellar biosynthesis protein FlhA n=1 Tax=Variovorax arabinosiphilus TaxID=3053498 RepID=UPI0025758851|nr:MULTISPECIES: flagellar biosynthesis protein FlhA [unclassified Variovorax]MDM0122181.1 flagellar biosynthesis protein FlhA [Variovorax sp. J2L1-78]MDM0131290.1 flagellar biosynthesis protein FlhA [Variovorax sp. J2L1-63]MDM0234944.1 flagellar biosynthesis protein FlhA [Variovorax sp. J2R1-6]